MEEMSLVDRMKSYQYLYDIISYKIEEELYKKQHQMETTLNYYHCDDINSEALSNYNTYTITDNLQYTNPLNTELKKKLEKNLPEECFIRDEEGNLKKVSKAEVIKFELKEQLDEWYKHSMLTEPTVNREYVLHTGSAGRDMFYKALQNNATNYYSGGLSTENHL